MTDSISLNSSLLDSGATHSISIIGGGAGGIFAALGAQSVSKKMGVPLDVHLFERNPRIGIKILISGGGKCNITHAGSVADLLLEGFPRQIERRFLRHAMYRFTSEDVLSMLARHGVPVHARDNGRVFPNSGRAEDVLAAFERELRAQNVTLHPRSYVESLEASGSQWQIVANGTRFLSDAVIVATGGTSYAKTGTTGDGIRYAAMLGHTIVPIRAALAPIYLKQPPHQETIGIAFRNAAISIVRNENNSTGTVLATNVGDVLVTHRGLSGPAALGIGNRAAIEMESGAIAIEINLLNERDDALRERLIQEQQSKPQQQLSTWLDAALPNRFVPFILAEAQIDAHRKWNALTREERNRLLQTLTRFPFGLVADVPLDRGEVTSGGVALTEVDPKTMMSKLRRGLFFAGEMLDIAGEIGGYNLQAAYSTGWVAGETAAKLLFH